MKKPEIEERLNAIIDVPKSYGKKVWTLKSFVFNEEDENVTMTPASGNPITKMYDAIEYFLEQLKPIEENKLATIRSDTKIPELIMTLRDLMLDDIEKIKSDKSYIPQAKAVNNNVNTIINLARLQMKLMDSKT